MTGIDCCYRQGDIDWKKAHADGIDFMLPREGWGVDCDGKEVDPKFFQNTKEALEVGVAVPGIWHFIYGINEAEARQNAACAINNLRKAGLPRETVIWCDLEYDTVENARKHRGVDLTAEMQRRMAEAFCDYCLAQGYPTGIYLNADYIENVYGRSILDKYDIWLADLSDGGPGYPCVYQQYGWHGHYAGCPVDVDEDRYIGQYTTGTAKPKGGNMPHIVYTEKQLTDILRTLASGRSSYKNEPPYNLLYWDGSRWWADCVNLYKALFNGRSIVNPAVGSFQADLSNTGDCTEWQLLNQCTSISTDFSKLGNQFRCLYKDGHFGGYLGYEWNEPGQGIVNSVEATPAWEDGIQFSYVQSDGRRFWAKGKSEMPGWTHHGLATPWIDYSGSKPQPTPTPTPTPAKNPSLTLAQFIPYLGYVARGSEGTIVEMLQRILKDLGYYTGYLDGECGDYTVKAITAIQKDWHANDSNVLIDGSFGKQCWTKLIK